MSLCGNECWEQNALWRLRRLIVSEAGRSQAGPADLPPIIRQLGCVEAAAVAAAGARRN